MMKENEKDLKKPTDEKLADDELEQVAGGHLELVQDEPMGTAGVTVVAKGLSRGDHQA